MIGGFFLTDTLQTSLSIPHICHFLEKNSSVMTTVPLLCMEEDSDIFIYTRILQTNICHCVHNLWIRIAQNLLIERIFYF